MPIYHKTPPSIVGNHATSEIDNHTSEAAKVKRTREHAYFNSYDFDAIEVLPYDDDDEEEEEEESAKRSKQHLSTTTTTNLTPASSQQKHGKSMAATPLASQTRQHLQQPANYGYPLQQPYTYEASKLAKTSKSHHSSATNSDNFIVDNLPQRSVGHNVSQVQQGLQGQLSNIGKTGNNKHHSYLQRFGVALFGGVNVVNNNKSPSLQKTSSSSSASATSSTSSSLADDGIKHLKVSSSELSSASNTRATTPSSTHTSASSSAASATASAAMAPDSLNCGPNHRDATTNAVTATKCGLDNNVSGNVKDAITSSSSPACVATSVGGSVAVATAAAATSASADGNFLLPRAMLKYQR